MRIAPRRVRLWAVGLALIGLVPILGAPLFGFHDWPAFWSAGALAGTADLLERDRQIAWQLAHGLPAAYFPYPPGVAWAYAPFAQLPLGVAFWAESAIMLCLAVGSGIVASLVYGLSRVEGVLAVLAWAPATASIVIGQNGPLGLLLALLAIWGLVAGRQVVAGFAVGLLLYKPTFGLPLAGLLVLRRQWHAAALAAGVGLGWFLVGAAATGGQALWPMGWLDSVRAYADADLLRNADKAVSLPGLVGRLPVPAWVPWLVLAVGWLVALPKLARARILEAASATCLLGVAFSPHAWGYDAVLGLPLVLWVLADRTGEQTGLAEPWRTRLVAAAYLLAPLWLVSLQTVVSAVAVLVVGSALLWLAGGTRPGAPASTP